MSREETTQPQEPVYRFYERSVSTDGCQGVGCTSGRQKGGGYRHFMRPHKASVSPSRMCKSSTFYGRGAKDTQTRERLPRMRPKIYDCVSICANVSAEHGSGQGRLCEGEGLRVWPQNRRLGKKHMMISSTRNADYAWGPASGQQVASVCLSFVVIFQPSCSISRRASGQRRQWKSQIKYLEISQLLFTAQCLFGLRF